MMLSFNPNKPPKRMEYATYIPDRSPQFKMHTDIGKAHNALSYNGGRPGILYNWNGNEWIEIDRYERATHCWHCGVELVYYKWKSWDAPNNGFSYEKVGKFIPKYKRLQVCHGCYSKHWGYRATEPLPQPEVL